MNKQKTTSFLRKAWKKISQFCVYAYQRTKHNFVLKVLSVFFAVILCSVIMTQANPERKTTLSEVPVAYTGLETLKANNLTLSLEQSQTPLSASVVLNVPMQELSLVDTDRVQAYLDLSNITMAGQHEVSVSVTTSVGTIRSRNPARITVTVENLVSKTVPVRMQTQGSLYENYSVGATSVQPGYVTVTGPESAVEMVYQAAVRPSLNGETRSISASMPLVLLDEDGDVLSSSGMTLSSTGVVANVEIRKSVELPVNAVDSVIGEENMADGYVLSSVEVYPETVTVTGTVDLLANIQEVHCSTLSVSQVTGTEKMTVSLVPISGLTFSTSQVEVQVTAEPVIETRVFTGLTVNAINVGNGLTMPELTGQYAISATGPKAALDQMNSRSFELVADCFGLSAGTHQVKLRVVVENDYAAEFTAGDLFVSPGTVTVTLEAMP